MSFLCILGSFLRVNAQNENIFAWLKFQIFFGVLDIPDIFWRQTVDAGPNATYEEKVRVPPTTHTHTHTHTHSPWVTVFDEKLLAKCSVMADCDISGNFIEVATC